MASRLSALITASGKTMAAGMAKIKNSGKRLDGLGRKAKNLARIWMAII